MRRNGKYNVAPKEQRTDEAGTVFDSKGEMARWRELQGMEERGEIVDLRRQVPYRLLLSGDLLLTYVADFVYGIFHETLCREDRQYSLVVEDWKPGVRTEMYRLKRKLMKAIHGIDILETGRRPKKRKARGASSSEPSRAKRVTKKVAPHSGDADSKGDAT